MINEHSQLEDLARSYPQYFRLEQLATLKTGGGAREPVYAFHCYDKQASASRLPTLALFAGVHGIEAIGVRILQAFLEHLVVQAPWNRQVQELLNSVKIVGIPIVNPVGFLAQSRCNGNGIDLMRNAPVESSQPWWFVGGQKITSLLPYFRGYGGLEQENQLVCQLVEQAWDTAPFTVSLDLHSGFGLEDHLWTPYAKEQGFPPTWRHYLTLKDHLDGTLKNHVYRFGPQSENYRTSGDLWDYLYDRSLTDKALKPGQFMPLTLEVGSWAWVKKAPRSALRATAFFNPMHPHREKRVLRRHLPLLNFLAHVVGSYENVFVDLKQPRAAAFQPRLIRGEAS